MEEYKDLKRSKWQEIYNKTISKIVVCSFDGKSVIDTLTGLRVSIRNIGYNDKDTILFILNNKIIFMKNIVRKNIDYLLHTHFSDLGMVNKGEYFADLYEVLIETSFGNAG